MKIRCLECNKWFEPVAGERICSAGCRHARKTQQARASNSKRTSPRFVLPREPVEMAVVLPFNPSNPFLTDADRRVCAEARP